MKFNLHKHTYIVFTSVFNFLGQILASIHVLLHFWTFPYQTFPTK
jgi:hypothetical protein